MTGGKPVWRSIRRGVFYFLLVAFIVSCCLILFLRSMQTAMGAALTEDMIKQAAKVTFANVLLLSLLFTVIDGIRRRLTVERPVSRILEAADKIMQGDFSARAQPVFGLGQDSDFNTVIDCFNRMAQELSGMETLRTDFIANVSHELKTPLAVIQNYGTMLKAPNLSEAERQEYAAAITEASKRLADLITNILKLNKLENQQLFPEKKTYDLSEQLCECLLAFESQWEKKGLDIETDIEDGILVETDPELMTLVWNNLFSNAIKFTEPGGTVSLSVKSDGELASVTVTDTGCGIGPETGAHIFEKFYQGDTSHAAQGNGLGLALVKRVIDIVGGDISVQSEVGKGSAFTVRLPKKGAE